LILEVSRLSADAVANFVAIGEPMVTRNTDRVSVQNEVGIWTAMRTAAMIARASSSAVDRSDGQLSAFRTYLADSSGGRWRLSASTDFTSNCLLDAERRSQCEVNVRCQRSIKWLTMACGGIASNAPQSANRQASGVFKARFALINQRGHVSNPSRA
jgi:hypothetical protein